MHNSTFKAIPENDNFKIPFKLKQESLIDWLLALANYGNREACAHILCLLQNLNKIKLSNKKRLGFLNTISDYLEQYLNLLAESCWDASFPLSKQEQDCVQIVTWSYLVLAESFFIASENSANRDDEVFTLYKALFAIGKAQLHIAAVYSRPNHEFWRLLYKIFARAEKQKLLTLEINETDLKGITVNAMFAQIIIFQICDTRQFCPKEMQSIFNFLANVCDQLIFYKLTDLQFQTDILEIPYLAAINTITYRFNLLLTHLTTKLMGRDDLFIIDLEQDRPPLNSNGKQDNITPSTRYFCPSLVANAIYQLIEKGGLWNGVLKSINNELFSRVAKTIEPGQKRKYKRKKEHKILFGMIGFDSISSFLYKTTQKDHSDKVKTGAEFTPTFSTYEDLKNYADNLKKAAVLLSDEYADFELSYKFRYPESQPHNIWQSHKKSSNAPTKKVFLKKITILDSSTKGYSVSWNEYAESKAKMGDIFGVISEDKKRLEIAIIRRIAISDGDDLSFGSELLGCKSEIVYITHADSEIMDEDNGEWAVFIPEDEKLEQFDSLIYNSSRFKVGDTIYLHRDNGLTLCLLRKELHLEATMSHVELKY